MGTILTFGEPMIEFNQSGGERLYLQGFGGDTSNVAIAAARQQASAAVMTALGRDAFGDLFIDLWARENVSATAVRRFADAPTGIYFVTHTAKGHVFHYRRQGSAASRFSVADIDEKEIASAAVLHVSGITLAISKCSRQAAFRAIELARRSGVTVSLDTNLRLNLWPLEQARSVIQEAAALADIVLPGLDDARALTSLSDGDAIADVYLGLGAGIVALTLGARGALVATPSDRRQIAPVAVNCVDATGAGDTFDGAFLAEYAATGDPFAAARYANAAAALSTTGFGAVEPIPYRLDVEAVIGTPAVEH